jgi:hypothetical protein
VLDQHLLAAEVDSNVRILYGASLLSRRRVAPADSLVDFTTEASARGSSVSLSKQPKTLELTSQGGTVIAERAPLST